MRVLLVEDDLAFAVALSQALRNRSMAVDVVHDGLTAVDNSTVFLYDVVILDRDLPGLHGDEVARILAASESAPRILMLTAARSARDAVQGLSAGADDYLAKPFHLEELVARLWALSRRSDNPRPPALARAGIALDPFTHTVQQDGAPVELTKKEFAVLHVLMAAEGGVVSAETILEKAWDESANPFTNSIRMTISNLRGKLRAGTIETVAGVGYQVSE